MRAAGVAATHVQRISVHTDAYFAENLAEIATWPGLDSLMLGDEAGVLTSERARTFIPAMLAVTGETPTELHFHNNTGLGTQNYLIGVEAGAQVVHTACGPMANGVSLPSIEATYDNLTRLGYDVAIDADRLPRIAEHFEDACEQEGFAPGAPLEYRIAPYQQQIPGGMMGTLKNQLAIYGMSDRLPEVLEEVSLVRAEMGYPVMATPFSQLVGTQALLNVLGEERYATVPDENLMYLAGHYGPHPGPVAPEVTERAFSTRRGREVLAWEQPQPTLAELRQQHGINLSDEELILRYLIPGDDVDAMFAAGPLIEDLMVPKASPRAVWAADLLDRAELTSLDWDSPGLSLRLRR